MNEAGGGRLVSVNVGELRELEHSGRVELSGIFKEPVRGRVAVAGNRVAGDHQGNPNAHGGYDKAVYAYAIEDTRWWESELGRELAPGWAGENLSTEGLDVSGAAVGERWRIGAALLEVSEPRQPCTKLAVKLGDPAFVKTFADALRPGAYLRVIEEGEIGAGDPIEVVERPDHGVTMRILARLRFGEHDLAERALEAPALSPRWREWASARATGV